MQNRYAGDVGDFGKFGLLRHIAHTGLQIGLNWYLVPDENHNDDGKHIGYLNNKSFIGCDDDLLRRLRKMIYNNNRNVKALEEGGFLPNSVFYNRTLYPPNLPNVLSRLQWHENALTTLSNCDIVFLDPDNGLIVKSVSLGARNSNKYLTENELLDYYQLGKSVIFYNHRCRQKEDEYLDRFQSLKNGNLFERASWAGIKFTRGTIRDYFFIMQPHHAAGIDLVLESLSNSQFNKHFSKLNL